MLYPAFDFLMRIYAKLVLLGILIFFLAGEFGPKSLVNNIFLVWISGNCALLFVAWLIQIRLERFVRNDSDLLFRLYLLYQNSSTPFPHELVVQYEGWIPAEIKPVVPEANEWLTALRKAPFILEISTTQFDYDWRRLSWIRISKEHPEKIIESLRLGDTIYYHNKRSIIGKIIRCFTRSFWEHVAFYIGEGEVLDVAPGGIKRVKVLQWLLDANVDLSVIRVPNIENALTRDSFLKQEGKHYNYRGVFRVWWKIITGQTGLGGIGFIRVLLYCAATFCVARVLSAPPVHTRIEAMGLFIFSVYAIQSIYHPIAYSRDLNKAFDVKAKVKYEES